MKKVLLLVAAAAALALAVPAAFARGGDDGPGDDRGKDAPAQVSGQDDPAGHDAGDDKGGQAKGADDPANHDANDASKSARSTSSSKGKKAKVRAKARAGSCTIRSRARFQVNPPKNGRIQVEFEVESRVSGQVWNVLLTDNGHSFFTGKATTKAPSGELQVRSFAKDRARTDAIWASATNPVTGETCSASVSV